jgi:pimeloyl-ACP methyl ester carboxylesterase
MDTVTSRDGTLLAFDRSGHGPPIVFVAAAFNDRSTLAPVAKPLEPQFTVITYDRRGRGDSGAQPRTQSSARSKISTS